MNYITIKRARFKGLCGEVNLPHGTTVSRSGNCLVYQGLPLCTVTSQNAYDFFARDDDGHGEERGELTQAIQKALAKRDAGYQERWNRIWADQRCRKYKRTEHADYWLWNFEFYNAPLCDLQHIAALIRA